MGLVTSRSNQGYYSINTFRTNSLPSKNLAVFKINYKSSDPNKAFDINTMMPKIKRKKRRSIIFKYRSICENMEQLKITETKAEALPLSHKTSSVNNIPIQQLKTQEVHNTPTIINPIPSKSLANSNSKSESFNKYNYLPNNRKLSLFHTSTNRLSTNYAQDQSTNLNVSNKNDLKELRSSNKSQRNTITSSRMNTQFSLNENRVKKQYAASKFWPGNTKLPLQRIITRSSKRVSSNIDILKVIDKENPNKDRISTIISRQSDILRVPNFNECNLFSDEHAITSKSTKTDNEFNGEKIELKKGKEFIERKSSCQIIKNNVNTENNVEFALKKKIKENASKKIIKKVIPCDMKSFAEKKRVWKGQNGSFKKELLENWYKHMGN